MKNPGKIVLIAAFSFLLAGMLLLNFNEVTPETVYLLRLYRMGTPFLLFFMCLLVPLIEELIFRSWTISVKRKKDNGKFVLWAIISSLIFAFVHFNISALKSPDFIYMAGKGFVIFGLGLFLSYIAYFHKFIYAIVVHSLYNVLIFVLSGTGVSSQNGCVVEKRFSLAQVKTSCRLEGGKIVLEGYPDEILRMLDRRDTAEYKFLSWYVVHMECSGNDTSGMFERVKKTLVTALDVRVDTIEHVVYEIKKIPAGNNDNDFLMKGEDFVRMLSEKTGESFTMPVDLRIKTLLVSKDFIFVKTPDDAVDIMKKEGFLFEKKVMKSIRYIVI